MKKLSKAQERAYNKLSYSEYKNAYTLKENLNTLYSLVGRDLADIRHHLGSMAFPNTNIFFRKK